MQKLLYMIGVHYQNKTFYNKVFFQYKFSDFVDVFNFTNTQNPFKKYFTGIIILYMCIAYILYSQCQKYLYKIFSLWVNTL